VNVPVLSLIVPAFLLGACGGSTPPPADANATAPEASTVTTPAPKGASIDVPLAAKSNSKLSGKATFVEVEGGVQVTVQVAGLQPGMFATHVHEKGDCSAPDAESAGEHFNPVSKPHGLPTGEDHHLGDPGNIDVKSDGTATTEVVIKGASLKPGDPTSFVGRAIIVHEKRDDGGQPSGNAGARIGCGVITSG